MFKIGDISFSQDSNCIVIAEACDNHFGSMDNAYRMIDAAKEAGAHIIKFQHHLADEEMLPDVPMSDNFDISLYEFLIKNALTIDQHILIKEYCEKAGIQYLCTPFSYQAAKELVAIGVEGFKIGSGELADLPSLSKIGDFGFPMILSTGMSIFEEIDVTYQLLNEKVPLAFMNCLSEYPPLYEDMNLNVIPQMIKRYPKAIIGHSDHTPDLYTCFAAVTLGAKIIEKHVTLDKSFKGPDQSVSIDFQDLKELVQGIKKIELSLGSEKVVHQKEKVIRSWAHRSVVSTTNISKGEIIEGEMVWTKRPGTGIPASEIAKVIGKKAKEDIQKNSLISWEQLEV